MKKLTALVGALLVCAAIARAGLDMYNGKNYTTIVAPTSIGACWTSTGLQSFTTNTVAAVSNTPVSFVSYPGNGALILNVNCGTGGGSPVITASIYNATNIGTASAWTNGAVFASTNQAVSSWSFSTSTNLVALFRPAAEKGRVMVLFTATSVTNGSVSAMAVTE